MRMFISMFAHIHSHEYVPIPKIELSKQIFDHISSFYHPLLNQIDPYKLGEKKRKLDIGEEYAHRILTLYNSTISQEEKKSLIEYLVNGFPDHGFVIDYKMIAKFLPNVKKYCTFEDRYAGHLASLSSFFLSTQTWDPAIIGFSELREGEMNHLITQKNYYHD